MSVFYQNGAMSRKCQVQKSRVTPVSGTSVMECSGPIL
uniref:Uncharacterized protein n=1 Tax=Anguilla anguilla TaxID=7936 RepID=A0A0E9W983_ANGAN